MKLLVLNLVLMLSMSAVAGAAQLAVAGAWSRPALVTGVVYLTVRNAGAAPDRLVRVTSPVAKAVELHESMETKMPMAMGGIASMHPVSFIPLPPHRSVKLAPGGYHVMLIDLHHPLQSGETFPIRLYFAHAPPQAATVHVNPN